MKNPWRMNEKTTWFLKVKFIYFLFFFLPTVCSKKFYDAHVFYLGQHMKIKRFRWQKRNKTPEHVGSTRLFRVLYWPLFQFQENKVVIIRVLSVNEILCVNTSEEPRPFVALLLKWPSLRKREFSPCLFEYTIAILIIIVNYFTSKAHQSKLQFFSQC